MRFGQLPWQIAVLSLATALAAHADPPAQSPGATPPGSSAHPHGANPASAPNAFVLQAGRFGDVTVYPPSGAPRDVVLFFSGDGGWNLGVVEMAEQLRHAGALVAGVDLPHYFAQLNASRASCENLGGEFERLSKLVQQRAGVMDYRYPVLVGYSSGATLVYAALIQTPKGIFAGGLSLGFCPDLELAKPLCKGAGLAATKSKQHVGIDLLPAQAMPARWIALHGDKDQVCDVAAVERFVAGSQGAELVRLPKVGHGFSVPANWLPQFQAAFGEIARAAQQDRQAPESPALKDLPLVEVPASAGSSDEFVVLITGDGGYAGMDQDLAAGFAARGRPTVVLNSLEYFWTARTPEHLAADLERIVLHYASHWRKSKAVLVGYSMGADVLPFALNRLPSSTRARVASAAMIGIASSAVFEFRVANWLHDPKGVPTSPELARLRGIPLTCVYSAEEKGSVCPSLPADRFRLVKLPGGHHFNGDSQAVVRAVLLTH